MQSAVGDRLTATELLGLPGVGKSFVKGDLAKIHQVDSETIEPGFSVAKLVAIGRGAIAGRRLWRLAVPDMLSAKTPLRTKRWFVLFERIGQATPSALRDEGVVQAIWAIFHTRQLDDENLELLDRVLDVAPLPSRVVYVTANRESHQLFKDSRERRHAADLAQASDARRWMAAVVRGLRATDRADVLLHRNSPRPN